MKGGKFDNSPSWEKALAQAAYAFSRPLSSFNDAADLIRGRSLALPAAVADGAANRASPMIDKVWNLSPLGALHRTASTWFRLGLAALKQTKPDGDLANDAFNTVPRIGMGMHIPANSVRAVRHLAGAAPPRTSLLVHRNDVRPAASSLSKEAPRGLVARSVDMPLRPSKPNVSIVSIVSFDAPFSRRFPVFRHRSGAWQPLRIGERRIETRGISLVRSADGVLRDGDRTLIDFKGRIYPIKQGADKRWEIPPNEPGGAAVAMRFSPDSGRWSRARPRAVPTTRPQREGSLPAPDSTGFIHLDGQRFISMNGRLYRADVQGRHAARPDPLMPYAVQHVEPLPMANQHGLINHAGAPHIKIDQWLYRVRYDADKATWRIIAPPPYRAATVPVRRNADGAWQVNSQIGLLGGAHPEQTSPVDDVPRSVELTAPEVVDLPGSALAGSQMELPTAVLADTEDISQYDEYPGYDNEAQDAEPAGMSMSGNTELLGVAMGELVETDGAQVLATSGLSDCSAITLLSRRDPHSGVYRQRTMLHITGSALGSLVRVTHPDGRRIIDAGAAIESLILKAGAVDSKLIIAFGERSSSLMGRIVVIAQDYKGRTPLLSLIERVGAVHTRFYVRGSQCEISSRGEYLTNDPRAGELSDSVEIDLAMAREHV